MLSKPPPPDLHQAIRALLLAARAQVRTELAKRLSEEFGAGFDVSNLRNMRRLFLAFPIRARLERAGVGAKRRMRQVGRSRHCASRRQGRACSGAVVRLLRGKSPSQCRQIASLRSQ